MSLSTVLSHLTRDHPATNGAEKRIQKHRGAGRLPTIHQQVCYTYKSCAVVHLNVRPCVEKPAPAQGTRRLGMCTGWCMNRTSPPTKQTSYKIGGRTILHAIIAYIGSISAHADTGCGSGVPNGPQRLSGLPKVTSIVGGEPGPQILYMAQPAYDTVECSKSNQICAILSIRCM